MDIPKCNIPLSSTTQSKSKIDPPKELKPSTFSEAKKIFQELEAKNSPKRSLKNFETMRSSVNVPYSEKSEVSPASIPVIKKNYHQKKLIKRYSKQIIFHCMCEAY
ncbi:unnamed protein product [Diabrotica balteata]|uniref:Uncharacterized protein n=1 Tax=Diabrotica balteata TaxID=107213 RepID=A0A9N9SZ55_DIABA|nr:unnamed protein product [Diabrotica balteata]